MENQLPCRHVGFPAHGSIDRGLKNPTGLPVGKSVIAVNAVQGGDLCGYPVLVGTGDLYGQERD